MITELTPMMRQYLKIKKGNKDAILLFRLGDFYEMFFDDAKVASKILHITLTSRAAGKGGRVPMCGVPYHAIDNYIARLVRAGHRVAICEQVEDPAMAKGIVRRETVRLITPGTALTDTLLEEKRNNFLVAVNKDKEKVGLSLVDLSTGEFKLTELKEGEELGNELTRLSPAECLLPERMREDGKFMKGLREEAKMLITHREDFSFLPETAYQTLISHFHTHSLEGFGCEDLPLAIGAAGALIDYLKETQKTALSHIAKIGVYYTSEFMVLDGATQRNLELTRTFAGVRGASLLTILDETVTSMGGRKVRKWMLQPLCKVDEIKERQEAVEEFFNQSSRRKKMRQILKEFPDLERLSSRASCGLANARDLVALGSALRIIPEVKKEISFCQSKLAKNLNANLETLDELDELISRAIVDEPPLTLREGGLIKEGYSEELDGLRKISREGKQWIANLQAKEIKRTGISSLKVKYNKVFGYYIVVTKPNLKLVPPDYIRKQTLVNAERFITPGLKDYESRVLGAEERMKELEYKIFVEVREETAKQSERIQAVADILATLDVLAGLAEVAVRNNYVRAEVNAGDLISIKDGRHPVLEKVRDDPFVPNDALLDGEENQLLIITGPNMAGKSTYIRQIALIVLMAQMGSFVPVREATIGVVDRIFTRVGALDELARGMSTFMIEMTETANILNNATSRSLIVLDEIGRGTSTFDGISIAWAVAEYIHDQESSRAKTLFATHYHELTELSLTLPRVKNYNVAVREWNEEVIFLRKVVEGGSDRSYGIHVAKLAGLPREVIERAKDILARLEKRAFTEDIRPKLSALGKRETVQLDLFQTQPHPVVEEIEKLDLENLSLRQALDKLYELKKKVRADSKK